jgi:uncharacterized protein
MRELERRTQLSKIEMRGKPGDGAILSGYVAKYDVPSEVLWETGKGRFVEYIAPSAFLKTIQEADIRATRNHDPNLIVGRTRNLNNIRFMPDGEGLYHELDVPDTAVARSLYEDIELGLIDNMSFVFRTIQDSWDKSKEIPERRLLEVGLDDIAYVAYPAYRQSTAEARGALRSYAAACGCSLEDLPIAETTPEQEPDDGAPLARSEPDTDAPLEASEPDWRVRARRELNLIIL